MHHFARHETVAKKKSVENTAIMKEVLRAQKKSLSQMDRLFYTGKKNREDLTIVMLQFMAQFIKLCLDKIA